MRGFYDLTFSCFISMIKLHEKLKFDEKHFRMYHENLIKIPAVFLQFLKTKEVQSTIIILF